MPKVIIITGSRKGIGRLLAESFLNEGYIVAGCSRGEADIHHSGYFHYRMDVAEENSVVHMVREVEKNHGAIDVLINNAGIASMNLLTLTPHRTAENIINTNFMGTFLFTREAGKRMMKKKSGRIINFTTVAVPFHLEGESIYAASKSAVEEFTKISAKELGPFGITVNAIGPTPIRTDLIKNISEDKINAVVARQAIKRLGVIEDVMNLVRFFISESSAFVTGQIIYLGGVHP